MNAAGRILALAEARSIEATGRRNPEWMNAYLARLAAALMGGVGAGYLRLGAPLLVASAFSADEGPGPSRWPPGPPGPAGQPRRRPRGGNPARPAWRPAWPRSWPRSWPTGRRRHGG